MLSEGEPLYINGFTCEQERCGIPFISFLLSLIPEYVLSERRGAGLCSPLEMISVGHLHVLLLCLPETAGPEIVISACVKVPRDCLGRPGT